MTIQRKFAILLGLIGLSVIATLGASLWAVSLFERELSAPLQDTAGALERLDELDRQLTAAGSALSQIYAPAPAPEAGPTGAEDFDAISNALEGSLAAMTADARVIRRVGVGAVRTINQRARRAATAVRALPEGISPSAVAEARRAIEETGALIDSVSSRILTDATLAVSHAERIRGQLIVVLSLAFLTAILTCALGLILVRRWILRPIADLRLAADRIGAGEYHHRIDVAGRDEFAQLSHEVNQMAGLISRMEREHVERERLAAAGEMIRRLAHNIRNPLAGIRGLAEIARAELAPGGDVHATQERIIATIDKFEQWLADLLHNTSPLRIEPSPHEVAPWIGSIVDSHKAMAETRGVDLRLETRDAPASAMYDARHLEQAVVAVLSNAIEATPEGGSVRVSAGADDNPHWWRIRIEDDGPGIAPDMSERVFAANFTTKRDGHGIGLAVARQVVRGHRGRIFVEAARDGPKTGPKRPGASFVVLLPIEPRTMEPSSPGNECLNGASSGENSHH